MCVTGVHRCAHVCCSHVHRCTCPGVPCVCAARLCERVLACLVDEYILVHMCACACVSVCWRASRTCAFSCAHVCVRLCERVLACLVDECILVHTCACTVWPPTPASAPPQLPPCQEKGGLRLTLASPSALREPPPISCCPPPTLQLLPMSAYPCPEPGFGGPHPR